jgi:hypothetical protein
LLRFKKTATKPVLTSYQKITGEFSTNTNDLIETNLQNGRYLTEFATMAANDPVCGAVMLAITQIFKSIKWETYNDPDGILEQSLVNAGWLENMTDILSSLIFGHSIMEVTLTEKDAQGKVYWKNMHYRPQTSISKWKYNDVGDINTIVQMSDSGKLAEIKAAKCLLFHIAKSQSNPLGKSIFRNAYRDWYYKTNIEKIEAIGIERDLTGLPVLSAPEDEELQDEHGALNKVGQWAWQVVRNVKRNSQEGLVLPAGWEFNLVGSPGQRQFDLNDVINRYSSNMALSMLSQFLVLGVTNSSGSFALAKEQSGLFHAAVEGIALGMAGVVNSQFVGGKALQLFNDLPAQPMLKPVGVERVDLNDLASFLGRLLKYNIITPDDKLEEFLRDRVALPERDTKTSRVADVKLAYEAANPDTPDNETVDNPATKNSSTPDNKIEDPKENKTNDEGN